MYNVLSQAYDDNVSMQDLMPEVRDNRFQPVDPEDDMIQDEADYVAKPDQLSANANRYTHLVGVSKDYQTGGYMLHYGQDFSKDYEGKVYNAPPAVNLGTPNRLLDIQTNFGIRPQ